MDNWKLSLPAATLCVAMICGCGGGEEYREFGDADDVTNTAPADDHHHHDLGPNGGHLVELGDEQYHAEVVLDAFKRILTVYILGPDAKSPAPIAAEEITFTLEAGDEPQAITLTAMPVESDGPGQASRFASDADAVPESVEDAEDLHGSVAVTIDGTSLTGEVSHDHHGHDHHEHGDEHDHHDH
ncbi:hypothetical protein Mal4_07660 [Maioricimonas rarisocia]|uniref:Uncharacterized protein n=1 Tax=Maioricimonas rarisocia TaxID=2528026 RepID=A0A517Z1Y0_9PLAN|nr:hypothetical protein [Maioricimonas rarisocia]QDU36480.1 hypothetical protein Mal4_07660 [Maioricimonas rarisocia]